MKKAIATFCILFAAIAYSTYTYASTLSTDTIFKDISLQELVVKASRIKEKANGFTMNVIDKKMVRGKSVSQMMGFLPNISTDSNGRISIYNQSPSAIYIDGVRLMSLQELEKMAGNMTISAQRWNGTRCLQNGGE